jgi:hypothetical protein
MSLRSIIKAILGWCPGFEATSSFKQEKNMLSKTLAILGIAIMLYLPFSPLDGILRFVLMAFSIFIGIPLCWRTIRGYKERIYPEPEKQTQSDEKFGEFKINDKYSVAYALDSSVSSPDYYLQTMIGREWLHPDILWYRKRFLEKKKDSEKKKDA